jgi:hypothetical protein
LPDLLQKPSVVILAAAAAVVFVAAAVAPADVVHWVAAQLVQWIPDGLESGA